MLTEQQIAAMRQALEALKHGCPPDCKDGMTDSGGVHPWGEPALVPCPNCKAITALTAALEQQEPTLKNLSISKEWLEEKLKQGPDDITAGRPCDSYPGCNGSNCLGCGEKTAQQEPAQQEPVAYIRKDQLQKAAQAPMLCEVTPEPRQDRVGIYTRPKAREWVGLTEEEIEQCMKQAYATVQGRNLEHAFARAIEAKLKEKNQ